MICSQPGPGRALSHVYLAFQAGHHAMVTRFRAAALATCGSDNGAPGERPYHPAFALDPYGNNVEAVFHGPSTRSASSVVVTAK